MTLQSDLSGHPRVFHVYALPNPPEFFEQWFTTNTLVPILVGMSHAGSDGVGMVVDLATGFAIDALLPDQLDKNHKGHFKCEALRPGGLSSGQVPPAATYPLHQAWQAVGLDVSEWDVPGVPRKVKFALFIDLATKLRVVCPLMQYNFLEMKAENAEMLIKRC